MHVTETATTDPNGSPAKDSCNSTHPSKQRSRRHYFRGLAFTIEPPREFEAVYMMRKENGVLVGYSLGQKKKMCENEEKPS